MTSFFDEWFIYKIPNGHALKMGLYAEELDAENASQLFDQLIAICYGWS